MTTPSTEKKILTRPILIAIAVLLVGLLFKLMHWPGRNLIMPLSFGAIAILYFFRFLHKRDKRLADYIKLVCVVAWTLNGIFTILHLPYKLPLGIIAWGSLLTLFAMGEFNFLWSKGNTENGQEKKSVDISGMVRIVAIVLTLAGAVFQTMHWPGGIYMLAGGFGIFVIWFLKDSFSSDD